MAYLEEFQLRLEDKSFSPFLHLWEEYCLSDSVDGPELIQVLRMVKESKTGTLFGEYAESVLPLWQKISDQEVADEVLKLILDLQTTQSPLLADLATDCLKRRFPEDAQYNEKMRIVGLRARRNFQGAIRNFELLSHLKKGNFVFHLGGWGVGEVMEISLLREHVLIEFEGISAPKDLSFENAFRNLIPLQSTHFLARRFGNPDALEKEGMEDPLALIHLLLRDLGPKTAAEIKDELCDLVIPESQWAKWWQSVRPKLKKDSKVRSPDSLKEPFALRGEEISLSTRYEESLRGLRSAEEKLLAIYNFTRDFSELSKNPQLKQQLKDDLLELEKAEVASSELRLAHRLQVLFLLEDLFPSEYHESVVQEVKALSQSETVLQQMSIGAFKKRFLLLILEHRPDWQTICSHLLFAPLVPSSLRDQIFKELSKTPEMRAHLEGKLTELLERVTLYPEAFFWYFQKIAEGEEVPLNTEAQRLRFLEAFLILLHYMENVASGKDLVKKMYQLVIAKRYAVIRSMIQGASIAYLKEMLLLASKCHCFTKQDQKILQSLAEVVQPGLVSKKEEEEEVLWTTQEGYRKVQERMRQIATVETVDNAREIEAARALGDLRENSEYKFALERRSRLQSELKTLGRQVNMARILTHEDIGTKEVGVGTIVTLQDSKKRTVTYTLLGPWDADPQQNILSFQSKFAQAMIGCTKGETFEFQGEQYTVVGIKSFL